MDRGWVHQKTYFTVSKVDVFSDFCTVYIILAIWFRMIGDPDLNTLSLNRPDLNAEKCSVKEVLNPCKLDKGLENFVFLF